QAEAQVPGCRGAEVSYFHSKVCGDVLDGTSSLDEHIRDANVRRVVRSEIDDGDSPRVFLVLDQSEEGLAERLVGPAAPVGPVHRAQVREDPEALGPDDALGPL